jgi:hypothetical protein
MMPAEVVMGGIGSGARRSANAGDVEDALALDIRVLRRLGVVRTGECVCDTVHWSIGGLSAPSARLRVDLSDVERGGAVAIVGSMPDGAITQRISIEAVRAAIGGWRCYFICPVTARRCEVLYYAEGRFASRAAQRLTYATQNMTDLSRKRRRAAKLRGRLRGSGSQSRPRGRNRIELAERARDAEREAIAMYRERLSLLVERSDAPRMPGDR